MIQKTINATVVIAFLFFGIFLTGLYELFTAMETNYCEMTYMFQFPQFVEISLPDEVKKRNPRYSLFGYSEGELIHDLRNMHFTGVPVLFVPGNKGSYKQSRSLASVALRKALDSRLPVHFDFFAIDFDEDVSGIYGGVLKDETEFVKFSIKRIIELYKNRYKGPNSVVLIGHSVGGIVAKAVLSDPNFDPSLVKIIITLASPHVMPVIQPDPFLPSFYSYFTKFWIPRSANLSHVSLISIGGGHNDVLVRSDLTTDLSADLNVIAPSVPAVWCSTDHLSIVWCKQLVLTIIRALFDCVDLFTRQITDDKEARDTIFNYHMIKRSAGKKYLPHPLKESFPKNIEWVEYLQRRWSFSDKKGLKNQQIMMIRLISDVKHEALALQAVNLNRRDWIYVCSADDIFNSVRVCDTAINLSNGTEILPTADLKRKFFYVNLLELKKLGYSHVIVSLPQSTSFMQLNTDVHRISDRNTFVPVPRLYSLQKTKILHSTDNSLYYKVNLQGWDQIWQAFVLNLEAVSCKNKLNHAVVTFSVPWANQSQHFILAKNVNSLSVVLKLTSVRPAAWNQSHLPELRFILDPTCKYAASVQPARIASAGQLVRYYVTQLPGYILAILLLTLRWQLLSLHKGEEIPLFHNALANAVRNYYILLQISIFGSPMFRLKFVSEIFPKPDSLSLQDQNLDFFFLPLFLYGVAAALIYIVGAAFYCGIVIGGQAAHKVALRLIGLALWSEWIISGLQSLPIIAAVLLVVLSGSSVGGLALTLATGFYFLKICKLYEDYLESLLLASLKFVAKTIKNVAFGNKEEETTDGENEEKRDENDENDENDDDNNEDTVKEIGPLEEIHFHVTICLIYSLTCLICVPSILAWAKGFHQSKRLVDDATMIPSAILCGLAGLLWSAFRPKSHMKQHQVTSIAFYILAAISVMFCTESHYRLPYLVVAAITYLIVDQRF